LSRATALGLAAFSCQDGADLLLDEIRLAQHQDVADLKHDDFSD